MSGVRTPRYGRRLEDIENQRTYAHPWELTLDTGLLGLFSASMLDACPLYSSRPYAEQFGFRDRPVPPILLLNLALGMATHDLFEQAVGHLAYLDVRFPEAAYVGDTLRARTQVESVKAGGNPEHGSLSTRTLLETDSGTTVCVFRRKVLIRAGSLAGGPDAPSEPSHDLPSDTLSPLPAVLRQGVPSPQRTTGFGGFYDDFDVGDVVVHPRGRTIGETESMLLAQASLNTHPLHVDEVLCRTKSAANTRIVDGGLVLGWTLALTSRDFSGNAVWDLGLDQGGHPNDVVAGDTLYATTKIIGKEDAGPNAGVLTLRIVGTKNRTGEDLFLNGLFTPEMAKAKGKIAEKVVEITRRLLVLKLSRPAKS